MKPPLATVSFCCNDGRNGVCLEKFSDVEFTCYDDSIVSLHGPETSVLLVTDEGPPVVVVGDSPYPYLTSQSWVGNWCWDAVTMDLSHARALLGWLVKLGFEPHEWAIDGPLADLVSLEGRQ